MATVRRRLGRFSACSGSERVLVGNAAADVDNSGLWPAGGLFATVASAARAPVGAALWSRSRTVCCPVRLRGLDADAD
jgi:hypothetical protein